MPAHHTIAILGCAGAIILGATVLGTARLIPDDSHPLSFDAAPVSTNMLSVAAARVQQTVQNGLRQGAIAASATGNVTVSSETRGSLHYWRESNARRATTGERSAIVMPGRPMPAVTAERLAYERELFSREVKDNMLVPKATSRLANAGDADKRVTKTEAMAQASVAEAASAAPQKPKKKRIVRARDPRGDPRRQAPVMAFSPFGSPFAMR